MTFSLSGVRSSAILAVVPAEEVPDLRHTGVDLDRVILVLHVEAEVDPDGDRVGFLVARLGADLADGAHVLVERRRGLVVFDLNIVGACLPPLLTLTTMTRMVTMNMTAPRPMPTIMNILAMPGPAPFAFAGCEASASPSAESIS